jgi:serine/threonine protein kinase
MELCHGSLTTLIKFVGRMSEPIANDWLMQVSQALKYLHDSGIAHSDIKPDNILFKEHPQNQDLIQVKLTDFSLSHVFSPDSPPMTERAVGTFYYLAPELRDPEAHDAFKTDIYSLGMTLAESLVGVDKKNPPNFIRLVDTIRKRPPFRSISPLGQDLIRNMTILDANARFDINQVLAHQWTNQVQYIPGNYFSLI